MVDIKQNCVDVLKWKWRKSISFSFQIMIFVAVSWLVSIFRIFYILGYSSLHLKESNWILSLCWDGRGRISIKDWKNQSGEMVSFFLLLPFTVSTFCTLPADHAYLNVDPLTWLNVSGSRWSVHHCSDIRCLEACRECFVTASTFDPDFFYRHEHNISSCGLAATRLTQGYICSYCFFH